MWRSLFWRSALALTSMLVLTATFAASVLADSHPAPSGGGGDQAAAQGATQTVTAVPSTGVGTLADSSASALLLGLVAIAALMAVASLATARQHRA